MAPHIPLAADNWAALAGKRVLLRVDLNVPLSPAGDTLCDYRIRRMSGLIRRLSREGCKTMLISHLGQPKGPDPEFTLARFQPLLQRLVGCPVRFLPTCIGQTVEQLVHSAPSGSLFLFENLRFHAGETNADFWFGQSLARLGEVFINDAFSVSHRSHASVVVLPTLLPSYAGPAFYDEYLRALDLTKRIRPPVVVISGGRKLDKLTAYRRLLPMVDTILLGSGFAGALRQNHHLAGEPEFRRRLVFPPDLVVQRSSGRFGVVTAAELSDGDEPVDIGPRAAQLYLDHIRQAGTVVFNGSLGILPIEHALSRTRQVLYAVAGAPGIKVVCGGTGCSLFIHEGLAGQMDYVFPGGGALLTFLTDGINPGVRFLSEAVRPAMAEAAMAHTLELCMAGLEEWR